MTNALDDIVNEIKKACGNYIQTVQAIKALAHELMWDDSNECPLRPPTANAYFGRRMDTSGNKQVTPDLVVQLSDRYGALAEAKLTFPSKEEYRESAIKSIQKYDDDLLGWNTADERILNHDIILLVHHFHGRKIQKQINTLVSRGDLAFTRKFSIISFALVEQEQTFLSLALLAGSVSNDQKQQKFEEIVGIKLDHLAANPLFSHIKLYDDFPPLPFLMNLIHEVILNNLTRDQHFELYETNQVEIEVEISSLRKLLSEAFGPGDGATRIPEIPKSSWVRDAMGQFVKLGWSKRKTSNQYLYIFKKRRKHLEKFVSFYAKQLYKTQEAKDKALAKEKTKMPLFKGLIEQEETQKS